MTREGDRFVQEKWCCSICAQSGGAKSSVGDVARQGWIWVCDLMFTRAAYYIWQNIEAPSCKYQDAAVKLLVILEPLNIVQRPIVG